jgi:DNA-binding NarL/FixJ family response regulator
MKRQIECLQVVLDCNGDLVQAASTLGIQVSTLKSHLQLIYDEYQVTCLVAAIKKALLSGEITLGSKL